MRRINEEKHSVKGQSLLEHKGGASEGGSVQAGCPTPLPSPSLPPCLHTLHTLLTTSLTLSSSVSRAGYCSFSASIICTSSLSSTPSPSSRSRAAL